MRNRLAGLVLLATGSAAHAQDIEPRAYSNAPIGVNFLVAGYAHTRGGLAFDPALAATNPELHTHSAVLGYARVIEVAGQSANLAFAVPYTFLSGRAEIAGQPREREVDGFGDPRIKLSVNLLGAPALSLKEFQGWHQDLIVGVSLMVAPPTGRYDPSRAVNIGSNRWSFRPEIGISQAWGPLTLEGALGVTVFTDNQNFFGGRTRSQDPITSAQAHAIYGFRSGLWLSLDATYYTGGRTEVDGERGNDLQSNWRVGGTLSIPLSTRNSVKLYASTGVYSRTGNDYDLLGIAWQYRFGGGL